MVAEAFKFFKGTFSSISVDEGGIHQVSYGSANTERKPESLIEELCGGIFAFWLIWSNRYENTLRNLFQFDLLNFFCLLTSLRCSFLGQDWEWCLVQTMLVTVWM